MASSQSWKDILSSQAEERNLELSEMVDLDVDVLDVDVLDVDVLDVDVLDVDVLDVDVLEDFIYKLL